MKNEMTKEELLQALQNAYVKLQENENLLQDYRVDNSSPYELTTEHYSGDVCVWSDEDLEEDEEVWEIQPHTTKDFGVFLKQENLMSYLIGNVESARFRVSLLQKKIAEMEEE